MNDRINKFKTRTEMAHEYGVDRKTFRSILVKFGIDLPNGLISPAEQIKIYEKLGEPGAAKPRGGGVVL
ncbi:hypothetical protein [Negadavirga shengliensis]|uniref:Uncharacterized protein n=1 Tax=Negadavirga shengliensis TaxID=1389218 RepID=A0ABV9SXQ9_9BACT